MPRHIGRLRGKRRGWVACADKLEAGMKRGAGGAASGRTRKWMRYCTDGLHSAPLSGSSRLAGGFDMPSPSTSPTRHRRQSETTWCDPSRFDVKSLRKRGEMMGWNGGVVAIRRPKYQSESSIERARDSRRSPATFLSTSSIWCLRRRGHRPGDPRGACTLVRPATDRAYWTRDDISS